MRSFRELKVWQKAFELCGYIYNLTRAFPKEEKFALVDQVRRAAVSVVVNIAEGHHRATAKDYQSFLTIALGSLAELETLIEIAKSQHYVGDSQYQKTLEKITEVSKMLFSLRYKLRQVK